MLHELNFLRLRTLPDVIPPLEQFMESLDGIAFVLLFDFKRNITLLGFNEIIPERLESIQLSIPGISFSEEQNALPTKGRMSILSIYRNFHSSSLFTFIDLFNNHADAEFMALLFCPATVKEVEHEKAYAERALNSKHTKETHSIQNGIFANRSSKSFHYDSISNVEETTLFNDVIASLSDAMLSTNVAYKIFLAFPSSAIRFYDRIKKKFLILSKSEAYPKTFAELITKVSNMRALALGTAYSQRFVNFMGNYETVYPIQTAIPATVTGDIPLGSLMVHGEMETDNQIMMDASSLNLGFMVSGLPGTGKTTFAMSIINSIALNNRTISSKMQETCTIVITSTSEWRNFALAHQMYLIRIDEDKVPLNFFKPPSGVSIERFYEDLSTVLSSASGAGPYSNPLQKCMLRAFKQVYRNNKAPNPSEVYEAIERAIIELHAKRTNVGVKFTKHGENILSSLEELRGILSKPEFSTTNGIKIEELLNKGIVFDISAASVSTRPYFYALILNSIYAILSKLDENGDQLLRTFLCIEEAQTIFGEADSAASQDIKMRIQDFRKQGIGLMLITHNANDIDPSIRRLCQNKLYMRQAPDVARVAAKDLIFSKAEEFHVSQKLKLLASRVGALSYITKNGAEAAVGDAIFIKTPNYNVKQPQFSIELIQEYMKKYHIECPNIARTVIRLKIANNDKNVSKMQIASKFTISKFGMELLSAPLNGEKGYMELNLIQGMSYEITVHNTNHKLLHKARFKAEPSVNIEEKNGVLMPSKDG